MDAEQAGAFLESLIRPDPRPYAQRIPQLIIRELLAQAGNPQRRLRTIHIAGSKGKGSTALLIEAILLAAGRRVGTFTSPHLERWTERYRIDGREVDGARFAEIVERLRPAITALHQRYPDQPPSFFDAATAIALLLFAEAGVDYAILETGLGGRLDATTVVQPAVTCITTIELEHTDKLGATLAAIARHKAGIIKTGVPVVVGELAPPALAEIAAAAAAAGAPLIELNEAWHYAVQPADDFTLALRIENRNNRALRIDASLPVLGRHLAHNAALAVACVAQLNALTPAELIAAVPRGFAQARLPGRCEILSRDPWVIADSAHTPESARALAQALARLPVRERHLVLSLSAGKDPQAVCAPLLPAARITLTRAEPRRALAPEVLAAWLRRHYPAVVLDIVADPILAVIGAYRDLPPAAVLVITGSVYLAGIGRRAVAGFSS